jgi:16S rRNA processing protein RimM
MVVMGRVSAPYGVKGWVKVHSYTEAADSLLDFPVWWLGDGKAWRESRVVEAALHGGSIVARLGESGDRNAAQALQGLQIAVPRSSLPQAEQGEYYWLDLVGLRVIGQAGAELGVVESVIETGANDVLEVKGEAKHLIPFVSDYIVDVDLKNGLIRADWGSDY